MTPELFMTLLHKQESEQLDFKSSQYPFDGATDAEKGELLKDILAFANAWKTTDAYVLIGVKQATIPPASICGVGHHLDDAKLQQFVNSKTNRPVRFSYLTHSTGGANVGVLRIDASQKRPLFLMRNFGRLSKNVVYIRQGSSTAEATPDEIVRMATDSFAAAPQLTVRVVDWPHKGMTSGNEAKFRVKFTIVNRSRSRATVTRGYAVLDIGGTPVIANAGFGNGHSFQPDNDAATFPAETELINYRRGSAIELVSVVLFVSQDDFGGPRIYVPTDKGPLLAEYRDDLGAGVRRLAKVERDGCFPAKVALICNSGATGWVARDEAGSFELRADQIVPGSG